MNRNIQNLTFLIIFCSYSLLFASQQSDNNVTVHISKVLFEGLSDKTEQDALTKISQAYVDSNVTISNIEKLKRRLSTYYKNRGMLFTKVLLPQQDLSDGTLKFSIVRTKVENITVSGNKYYSTAFIKRNFHFQKGEYLDYEKMLRSLFLLNSYEDLSVKSYLKKGSEYGTTDINLEVKDARPFHATITYDNLGSKDVSKNRVSADVNYGNLLTDGDTIHVSSTFGIDSIKSETTKLLLGDYETTPFTQYATRLNGGYLYANYITAGDLSVLELQGDTYITHFGIKQPLLYTPTKQIDLDLNYYRKGIKSYLLGELSSRDTLNIAEAKLHLDYRRVYDSLSINLSVQGGENQDASLSSRYDSNKRFTKATLNLSYNRYVNSWNSFVLAFDSQYSNNRLPLSELYTIGGLSSVRGYEPAQKLGDSGFTSNAEWFVHPKIPFADFLKNALQLGFFFDYAKIFNNRPVPGEEQKSFLEAAGGEILLNVNKRLYGRLSVGYPLNNSDKMINTATHVYGYVGVKLW